MTITEGRKLEEKKLRKQEFNRAKIRNRTLDKEKP